MKHFKALFLFLAGAVAALGQAPFDLAPLTIMSLGGFFYICQRNAVAHFWHMTLAYGFGYFIVLLHWIIEPFFVYGGAYILLCIPALLLFSFGLSLFWSISVHLFARFGVWGIALGLISAEFLRSVVLTGFAWGLLGYIWIDTPLYHLAALWGPYGMSALTVLIALSMGISHLFVRGGMLVFVCVLWSLPQDFAQPPAQSRDVTVRLLHTSFKQSDRRQNNKIAQHYQNQLDLAAKAGAPDLTIWPESALINLTKQNLLDIEQITDAHNGTHLVGHIRWDETGRAYNGAAIIADNAELKGIYDKALLVPFGEYMPLGSLLGRFGIDGLAQRNGARVTVGEGAQVFDLPQVGRIQPLICYEGIFPHFIQAAPQRPDVLVLISNDAWFGKHAGPKQHFAQARARAIEMGLPLLRASNFGTTAVIDGRGRVRAAHSNSDQGNVDAKLPPPLPATLYARLGDWLFYGIWLGILFLALRLNKIRKGPIV